MGASRLAPGVALACALSVAGAAPAEPAALAPAGLRYEAPAACPGAAVFVQRVRTRLAAAQSAAFERSRLSVRIEQQSARPAANAYRGSLSTEGSSAALASSRSIESSSCDEVVEALSLLVALGVASSGEAWSPASSQAKGPARAEAQAVALAAPSQDSSSTGADDTGGVGFGPVLFALAQGVASPDWSLGVGLGAAFEWPELGALSPWLLVGAYHAQSPTASLPSGEAAARFELWAAYASACTVRFPRAARWALRPCLDADLGRLSGRGVAPGESFKRDALWASASVTLRTEVQVWGPLRVSAGIGAVVPFTRHEFYFAPDAVIFHVPGLGVRASTAIDLLF